MNFIKQTKENEPVRLYLYSALAAILGLLVIKGVISGDDLAGYLAVAAALLGVPAIEKARSTVDSPATSRAKQEALEAEYAMNVENEYQPRH